MVQRRITPGFDIEVWTDGSIGITGRGPAGWGAAFVTRDRADHMEASGGCMAESSLASEIIAVCEALALLPRDRALRIKLYSDNQMVARAVAGDMADWQRRGWKNSRGRRMAVVELWQRLDHHLRDHDVWAEWVRGHSGDPMNVIANQLARQARRDFEARMDAGHPPAPPPAESVVMGRWDDQVGRWDSVVGLVPRPPGGTVSGT